MNLIPFIVSWAILATVVLGLAVYRRMVAKHEDDYLHMDVKATAAQQTMAKKLEGIDKWGKLLTIIVAGYGVVLLAAFLYAGWTNSNAIQ